jgi:hypothetical protein
MRAFKILAILLFLQAPAFAKEPSFIEKLRSFGQLFRERLSEDFLAQISNDSRFPYRTQARLRQEAESAIVANDEMVYQMEQFYRILFLGEPGSVSVKEMDKLEMRVGILANQILRGAASALIDGTTNDFSKAAAAYQVPDPDEGINRGKVETLRMVTPFKNTTGTFACALLWDMCLRNRSILDIFHNNSVVENTRKPGTQVILNRALESLPIEPDSIIFIVMNHDVVLLEASLIASLTDDLGEATRFGVGIRSTYPHLKIWNNPDPNMFFIEDKNMVGNMLSAVTKTPGRVVIGVFPEGNRSTFGAQVPLSTKPGVPMIALRLAAQKTNRRPVYILPIRYNALEYVTTETTTLKVDIADPIRILPSTNLRTDLESLRLGIEEFINFERGDRLIDLKSPHRLPNTWGVYRTSGCAALLQ